MTSPITDERLNEILDGCEGETGEKVVGKQTLYLLVSELLAAREALRPKPGHWEVYWPAGTSKDGPAEARWVEDAPTTPTVNSGDGTK